MSKRFRSVPARYMKKRDMITLMEMCSTIIEFEDEDFVEQLMEESYVTDGVLTAEENDHLLNWHVRRDSTPEKTIEILRKCPHLYASASILWERGKYGDR